LLCWQILTYLSLVKKSIEGCMTIPTTARLAEPASRPVVAVDSNSESASGRFVLSAVAIRRLLVAIVLLAVLLRVGSALYQGNEIDTLPGVWDQVSYDSLAQRVLGGHGFSFGEKHWPATPADAPTAHWSFLYTLYLSGVYALFGPNALPARLIQAVLAGVLQTWLMWRLGKRVFGPTAGLLAAAFSAVYIYFVYYAGALITETFYITTLLWITDIALRTAAPTGVVARALLIPLVVVADWSQTAGRVLPDATYHACALAWLAYARRLCLDSPDCRCDDPALDSA
jgi:hypothetical protein